ncbi:hypothetical protein R1flu_020840 [Riccia fluitans]|uniref:Serine/threonine-protein phosphatase n=1 Tax=Riccia fluitans TaxID=41844 RepID=A0ABD1ZMN2_9MARC
MAPSLEESEGAEGERSVSEKWNKPLEWPGNLTKEWIGQLAATLDYASRNLLPTDLPTILPVPLADQIISTASKLMHREANCVEISVESSCKVVVIGDVHGQYHDVLHLLEIAGPPAADRIFVFNGDYVDRGAWGLETYLYLLCWKILMPHRVFLLRGNHETTFCTGAYGFEQEVMTKYADRGRHLYRKCLGCFEGHPLAAKVAGCVYLCHGGLFRYVEPVVSKKASKIGRRLMRTRSQDGSLKLGSLADLQKARRSVLNPSGTGQNAITADVLWSDPSPQAGLSHNKARGIGLIWGPDCTQEFMEKNNIKLIVRSHEGPDAREKRPEMAPMSKGFTVDHIVKAGKLVTLFSAPDYPQFQQGTKRYRNKGAFIVLEAPDFSEPIFHVFEAILPRPQAQPYYDFVNCIDSDEELDMGGSSEGSVGSSDEH